MSQNQVTVFFTDSKIRNRTFNQKHNHSWHTSAKSSCAGRSCRTKWNKKQKKKKTKCKNSWQDAYKTAGSSILLLNSAACVYTHLLPQHCSITWGQMLLHSGSIKSYNTCGKFCQHIDVSFCELLYWRLESPWPGISQHHFNVNKSCD